MKRVARAVALTLVALVALPTWAHAQSVPDVPDPSAIIQIVQDRLEGLGAPDLTGLVGDEVVVDTGQLGIPAEVPFRVRISVQMLQLALLSTIPRAPDVGSLFDLGVPGLPALPGLEEDQECSLVDQVVDQVPGVIIRICISVGPLPESVPEVPELPGLPEAPGVPGLPGVPELPGVPGLPGLPGVPNVDPTDPVGIVTDVVDEVAGGGLPEPAQGIIETVTGILGL